MSYQCSPCGETFSSLDLFDRHQSVNYSRTPAVRCKSVASLRRRGLVQTPTGTWTTPEGALRIAQASEMGKSRKKGEPCEESRPNLPSSPVTSASEASR